jgi:hypothetical protein
MKYLKNIILVLFIAIILSTLNHCVSADGSNFIKEDGKTVKERFFPPLGFKRISYPASSFQEWLRDLPLKDGCPLVHLYDGTPLELKDYHCAVVDLDVGESDLQQCADTVIRLRAEYLLKTKRYDDLHFNFTSGHRSDWLKWRDGWRPVVRGNKVTFAKTVKKEDTYKNFRRWLDNVFTYAGTISISAEFPHLKNVKDIRPGDFFVEAGDPGHAVIVVDVVRNAATGEKLMLLAQGYMPAQEMHILTNQSSSELSPWYQVEFGNVLETPRWDFTKKHLRRIPD